VRAGAAHEAIGEEHTARGIEELRHAPLEDEPGVAVGRPDLVDDPPVGRGVGAPVVVERDLEVREIALVRRAHLADQRLLGAPLFSRADHDGGPVGVVRADVDRAVAGEALEAGPDVGLQVLHQVAEVDVPIGVGQGARDQDAAGHGGGSLAKPVGRVTPRRGGALAGPASQVHTRRRCASGC
jgi:hypothetical protein